MYPLQCRHLCQQRNPPNFRQLYRRLSPRPSLLRCHPRNLRTCQRHFLRLCPPHSLPMCRCQNLHRNLPRCLLMCRLHYLRRCRRLGLLVYFHNSPRHSRHMCLHLDPHSNLPMCPYQFLPQSRHYDPHIYLPLSLHPNQRTSLRLNRRHCLLQYRSHIRHQSQH
jgi:hypothetical protein